MGENSKIEWTDHTFNPWIGCTKVSPACDNCYAEDMMDRRYGRARWGVGEDRVRTRDWSKPRRWNRDAAASGNRPFVFCASLADVFDNEVDELWRRDLMDLIEETPNLVWLLLTKRIGNVRRIPARVAGTRVAVGGPRGTSAASLIVEAYGDAVVPQIPECIGRAILRVEAGLRAVLAQAGSAAA